MKDGNDTRFHPSYRCIVVFAGLQYLACKGILTIDQGQIVNFTKDSILNIFPDASGTPRGSAAVGGSTPL
ncbi:MAG: hypothetical protein KAS60_06005 [Thermoplasmata archaeon]|nr:hypothetical protein [Candidatus Thermoplasmatota archaeon]MCK4949619.1 hypothetical protein [Thermoplasmata archaeon]